MDRPEMKAEARALIARRRLKVVLALLVPFLLYIVLYGAPLVAFIMTENATYVIIAVAVVILFLPVYVGVANFFLSFEKDADTPYTALLEGYTKEKFLKSLGRLLQMVIFIYIWAIFLLFPAWIKAFSYAMTPFILADDDFKETKENPITISREMMNGYKGELFVLSLSFIGWIILGTFTLHILTVVFVMPYFYQTLTLFYKKVKEDYTVKKKLAAYP
ncbi:MAG: DUF975 family protein [Bacillota bacterium]